MIPPTNRYYTNRIVVQGIFSEYLDAFRYSDSTVWAYIASGPTAIWQPYSIGGRKAIDGAPLFNQIVIMDDQQFLWKSNFSSGTCVRIDTDTFGNAFNYCNRVYGAFFSWTAITSDSSTIMYGNTDNYDFYKIGGSARFIKPIPLHAPAGKKWIKMAMGKNLLGLTSLGEVYMWNDGDSNYVKMTITGTATDIAASQSDFYMCIIHNYTGGDAQCGKLAWWGSQNGYIGDVTQRSQPFLLNSVFKTVGGSALPFNIRSLVVNPNTVMFLDSTGDVYTEGDNPQAELGNGTEIVNKYTYPTIYAWSTLKGEAYSNGTCYKIFTGAKKIISGNTFTMYQGLIDNNDSLWMWGRNKSLVIPTGANNIESNVTQNAMDKLSPFQTSGEQHPVVTDMHFSYSTLSAGSPQTVGTPSASLAASGNAAKVGTYGYTIVSYQWTQVSGPNTATITSPTSQSTTVTGLITGTYVFRVVSTDDNTGTATSTVSITYTPTGCPGCNVMKQYRTFKRL